MTATQEERVLTDLDFASDRLSTQVRQLALGTLALVWALFVGNEKLSVSIDEVWLIRIGFLAILTMAFDLFQYIAAFAASRRAWENLRKGGDGKYSRRWISRRLRSGFFYAKLAACLLTVVLLLVVLGSAAVDLR
jgi:hypothetical protein